MSIIDKPIVKTLMLKGEKGDPGDLDSTAIVDNLTTNRADKVLSAKQGKVLKDLVDANKIVSDHGIINLNSALDLKANTADVASEYATKESVNDNISSLDAKVNSLASGSPLVASSTSGMTDTTRVYVNTTDGKWYYYDGDSWEIGGTYQSTVLDDDSVSYINLDEELKANFNISYSEPLEAESNIGYCKVQNNTFTIDTNNSYKYEYYDLTAGKTYLFNIYNFYAMCGLLIVDSSNNIIYNSNPTGSQTNKDEIVLQIKQSNLKAYISHAVSNDNNYAEKNRYLKTIRVLNDISNNLKLNTDTTLLETIPGKYLRGAGWQMTSDSGSNILLYAMDKGKTYHIRAYNQYAVNGYVITDGEITTIESSYMATGPSSPTLKEITYTAETNGYIWLSTYAGTPTIEVVYNSINIYNENILDSKKVFFFGDSITAGTGSWADSSTIRSNNNMSGNNFAIGGMTFTVKSTSDPSNNILLRIKQQIALDHNVDYIIIQGGVNDSFQSLPIGTPLPLTDFTSACDTSTFSGAFEDAIRYILTEVPECKVGFIINANIPKLSSLINYMNIAKSICDKYGVPTLDLFHESGVCPGISSINNAYFLHTLDPNEGDQTHPTATCYAKYLNNKVEAFMKRI